MTAICGGGTSSAKSGFAASLFVGPSMIAALLNNIPTPWAVPLAGYIAAITYDLTTFCPADPPSVPTITATDVINLLEPFDVASNVAAGLKFQQLIGAYLWYVVCQCDSVQTPAAPSAPAAPTGMPQINPPILPSPTTTGCMDVIHTQQDSQNPVQHLAGGDVWEMTPYYFSVRGITVVPYTATNETSYAIPAGLTSISYKITGISGGPSTQQSAIIKLAYWNSSAASVGAVFIPAPTNGNTVTSSPSSVPSGATYVTLFQDGQNWTGDWRYELELIGYCGSTQPTAQQPCCPPDPILSGQLDQILGLVTLIQRQLAPFAYIKSTTHSGLTGSGELSVQGLLGALVTITGYGSNVGVELADPDVFFEAGSFSWGNADGFSRRELISCSPQISLPAEAGQYTKIAYTLPVGVTVSIQELRREP